MADTPLEQVEAPEAAREARNRHTLIMWLLLLGGLVLVCFAPALGEGLVPRHQYAPGNYEWNPDDAHGIAFLVRLLGLMAFAAGLVERIVLALHHSRRSV